VKFNGLSSVLSQMIKALHETTAVKISNPKNKKKTNPLTGRGGL
jgi:hypothetical protein